MTITHETRSDSPHVSPDRRTLVGWSWRVALILSATATVAFELPAWVRAPLSIAAAVVTVAFCVRSMTRRAPVDRVLSGAGVSIVALALLGLALNVLPWGLTAPGWGIGVGGLELLAVSIVSFRRPAVVVARAREVRLRPSAVIWGGLTVAALAVSIVWATNSFAGTHIAPLALSSVPSGTSMAVTISSGSAETPYDLVRVVGKKRTVVASNIQVGPQAPVTISVALTEGVRERIELVRPGTTAAVRELIFDDRPATEATK